MWFFPKLLLLFSVVYLCGWELTHMQKIQPIMCKKRHAVRRFSLFTQLLRNKTNKKLFFSFQEGISILHDYCEIRAGECHLLAVCCSAPLMFNRRLCVCERERERERETVYWCILSVTSRWVWLVLQVTKEIGTNSICLILLSFLARAFRVILDLYFHCWIVWWKRVNYISEMIP